MPPLTQRGTTRKLNLKNNGVMQLLEPLFIFARANEESRVKSGRGLDSWERKESTRNRLPDLCPAWSKLSDDRTKYLEIPERVRIIKDLFKRSIEGQGSRFHCQRIQPKRYSGFRVSQNSNAWHFSYIKKILHNRAVLGEWTPRIKTGHNKYKSLDPIPNYYPAIITEDTFYSAQKSLTNRKTKSGKVGESVNNLFTGLLWNPIDQASMTMVNKGTRGQRQVVTNNARRGKGDYVSFPYQILEDSLLNAIKGLNPDDVFSPDTIHNDFRADW